MRGRSRNGIACLVGVLCCFAAVAGAEISVGKITALSGREVNPRGVCVVMDAPRTAQEIAEAMQIPGACSGCNRTYGLFATGSFDRGLDLRKPATDAGRLLWRFRAAPANKMIMNDGHLSGRWPITSSPIVHNGLVYTAAGMPNVPGGYVFALDACEGKIIWQQAYVPFSGDQPPSPYARRLNLKDPKQNWLSPYGRMTTDGSSLFVRTYCSTGRLGLQLDLKTGENQVEARTAGHARS